VRTARPKSGGALLPGLLADVGVEARMKSNEADHRLTPAPASNPANGGRDSAIARGGGAKRLA
jgi:hypothetical protein